MRFMLLVIPKEFPGSAAEFVHHTDLVEKMARYNKSLQEAGVLLSLDGLHPPGKAVRVRFGGGRPEAVDGPFAESKELIGGYWMIQVGSREEAVEWARRAPMLDGDVIEVRQVQELSDFPEEVQKSAKF